MEQYWYCNNVNFDNKLLLQFIFADGDQVVDEDEEAMMKMMGFSNFDTTKVWCHYTASGSLSIATCPTQNSTCSRGLDGKLWFMKGLGENYAKWIICLKNLISGKACGWSM